MKSIIYTLITVIIFSIIFTAFPTSISGQTQTIKIHCIDNVSDTELLNESGRIIKNRLESYITTGFDLTVLENQRNIEINFKEKIDISEIESLLTSKARFEFFETFNRSEIIDQLDKNDTVFSLLNIPVKGKELKKINSSAILGFSVGDNKSIVDSYLFSRQITDSVFNTISFAWSYSSNGNCELFLLKKKPVFDGNFVKECVGKYYPDSDKADIIISFTPGGVKTWQEMTKQNIGKPIAIVMDNKVYHAPRVAFEIETGKCRITGDFSKKEVNELLCLINNEELPLNFEVIK